MIKRFCLNTLGFVCYVGFPLAVVSHNWDVLITTDVKTTLSTMAFLVILASVSVTKFIFKSHKLPFNVNWFWVGLYAFVFFLEPIIPYLKQIGLMGIWGSVVGSFLFKRADKNLQKTKEKELIQKTADKVKETANA